MVKLTPETFDLATHPDTLPLALQKAIELEHATIPVYLYALYSLKPESNEQIRQLILSVVLEEMLHMTLAANLLNAIGGTPQIDSPCFVPQYPGPLPGSVQDELVVHLRPFSIEQVESVFLVIEQPENPLHFPMALMATQPPLTIGQFYEAILDQIVAGGDKIFVGDPSRQVVGPFPPNELFAITDVETARRAIRIIVEQGEGTKSSPEDVEHDFAHYYRFNEIVKGRYLIRNPNAGPTTPDDQKFIYGGSPITFDPDGVWPVISDPCMVISDRCKAISYPDGSAVAVANNTFNYTYTSLLKVLHAMFNGQPDRFGAALGLMESLKEQAIGLMQMPLPTGETAGPSFTYQPTNP